jgi:hypothetical protein
MLIGRFLKMNKGRGMASQNVFLTLWDCLQLRRGGGGEGRIELLLLIGKRTDQRPKGREEGGREDDGKAETGMGPSLAISFRPRIVRGISQAANCLFSPPLTNTMNNQQKGRPSVKVKKKEMKKSMLVSGYVDKMGVNGEKEEWVQEV